MDKYKVEQQLKDILKNNIRCCVGIVDYNHQPIIYKRYGHLIFRNNKIK